MHVAAVEIAPLPASHGQPVIPAYIALSTPECLARSPSKALLIAGRPRTKPARGASRHYQPYAFFTSLAMRIIRTYRAG